ARSQLVLRARLANSLVAATLRPITLAPVLASADQPTTRAAVRRENAIRPNLAPHLEMCAGNRSAYPRPRQSSGQIRHLAIHGLRDWSDTKPETARGRFPRAPATAAPGTESD